MHRPVTEPRRSLYYPYRIHPFVRPPELDGEAPACPVAIVGAGPVGLTTAIVLAQHGIRSVVIEAEAQLSEGSRAIVLTRRSMEILQHAGVHQRFVEIGLTWSTGRSFYRGQEVYRMQMPVDEDSRFMPGTNLHQQLIEEYLVDAALASGRVDIRWQTKAIGLEHNDVDGDHATLLLDTPAGEYRLDAHWIVAADGGRSSLRRHLGLRFEGNAYSGRFVITDIKADIGLPTERLCHFDPAWNPGNNVLVHRQPNGIWRLDYRLPDDESPEQALEPRRLAERIDSILEMIGQPVPWEIDWATVYTANTLTLPDYRAGRVLFAGDAAHILPIFGVRGANTGFQDAENLAWKLALVESGAADVRLLDSYSHERVNAAREICAEGGRSTRFMSPPSAGYRLLRDATLSLVLSQDWPKDLLHWRTSRPHEYTDSPLNTTDATDAYDGGVPPGATLANVRLGQDDYLLDHLGSGFVVLAFVADDAQARDAIDAFDAVDADGLPLELLLVGGGKPRTTEGRRRVRAIADPDNRVAARCAATPGAAYLVRPDGHVCARWHALDSGKLSNALARAVARH
ncbi:MAG: FAD-dependent monooxygenase [Burkholderiaceae bacterium]|nr:FAD-dependent monooxygenase [Burkholderiaceae bacterium]